MADDLPAVSEHASAFVRRMDLLGREHVSVLELTKLLTLFEREHPGFLEAEQRGKAEGCRVGIKALSAMMLEFHKLALEARNLAENIAEQASAVVMTYEDPESLDQRDLLAIHEDNAAAGPAERASNG